MPLASPEDVGVDREGLGAERGVHHDIGGLAADAGQGGERIAVAGNRAAELLDEDPRQPDDVLRLGIEQADALDVLLERVLAERDHLRGRLDLLEQRARRLVDAGVGRLRRQHHGDEQLISIS